MIKLKNFELLMAKLISVNGIGDSKAEVLIKHLKDTKFRVELLKLMEEVTLSQTFGENNISNNKIVFSGCRPSSDVELLLSF